MLLTTQYNQYIKGNSNKTLEEFKNQKQTKLTIIMGIMLPLAGISTGIGFSVGGSIVAAGSSALATFENSLITTAKDIVRLAVHIGKIAIKTPIIPLITAIDDKYTPPAGGGGNTAVIKVNGLTIEFGHGGRHLEGTGLSMNHVNSIIAGEVSKKKL